MKMGMIICAFWVGLVGCFVLKVENGLFWYVYSK